MVGGRTVALLDRYDTFLAVSVSVLAVLVLTTGCGLRAPETSRIRPARRPGHQGLDGPGLSVGREPAHPSGTGNSASPVLPLPAAVQRHGVPDLHPHGIRRLNSDRLLTEHFSPAVYTSAGMRWLADTTMTSVILRHHADLRPAMRAATNAFQPWQRPGVTGGAP